MKHVIIGCLVGILLMVRLSGLDLSTAEYFNSDVNVIPMLPVEKQPAKISVRIRNPQMTTLASVEVKVSDENGKLLGKVHTEPVPAKEERIVMVDWIPDTNGYCKIKVEVNSDKDKATGEIAIPVVARQMYFPWFGGSEKGNEKLKYANVLMASGATNTVYWKNRGAITCLWKGVIKEMKTPVEYMNYLRTGLSNSTQSANGIMIDEMGNYTDAAIQAMPQFQGLQDFNQNSPEYFSALWICGSLRSSYCNITKNLYRKKGVDLLLLECYSNFLVPEFKSYSRYAYYDQRIDMARQQDIMHNTIIALGITDNADKFNLEPYEIEDEVRYVRRKAPEMPGIGFFHANGAKQEMVPAADDLCRKYYIEPVLQIWNHDLQIDNLTPKVGEELKIIAHVYNIGGMDAEKAKIKIYLDDEVIATEIIRIPALKTGESPKPSTVTAKVKLSKSKYYMLRAEILPLSRATVLDGKAERSLYVAE